MITSTEIICLKSFRLDRGTEAALVKVPNDRLLASDGRLLPVLVLLGLSAAFDEIYNNILSQRRKHFFGIEGTALDWFESDISDGFHTRPVEFPRTFHFVHA